MIWLASFPRSGNTFFRNVLFEVYGIASSTYHRDPTRELDADYDKFQVIKTHELPSMLPEHLQDAPAVYLVRDARGALSSIAHHRKDIVAPGSDFYNNLLEVIVADGGEAYFGGWSHNLRAWTERAALVIRFEDLIEDPIREVEKLRAVMDLPEPDRSKLPSFKQLKFGQPKYGAGSGDRFSPDLAAKHFRKGKIGSWKEEVPRELEQLIYDIHGTALADLGYIPKLAPAPKRKVLVESLKLFSPPHDGIKRYQLELMQNLRILQKYKPNWQIDLFYNENILPLADLEEHVARQFKRKEVLGSNYEAEVAAAENLHLYDYENRLMWFKAQLKAKLPNGLYRVLSWPYRMLPFRPILNAMHRFIKRRKVQEVVDSYAGELDSYDIIFTPLPQHHYMVASLKGQHVVTVHDLTHRRLPAFHTADNIQKSEAGMQAILKADIPLISISAATTRDLIELYGYSKEKIRLIYEAANSDFTAVGEGSGLTAILEKYELPNTPYFITLSTIEPRKNLKNVILAFQAYKAQHKADTSLFICGKKGWLADDLFADEAALRAQGIYFTGFVDDVDLPLLYSRALALCYLSYYEGFGLPILEAMQCGTPVIFGDNSSMPEVAGAGGIGVDVTDVTAIEQAMWQLSSDAALQESLQQAALLQTKKFTWLKTALETLDYFEELIVEK